MFLFFVFHSAFLSHFCHLTCLFRVQKNAACFLGLQLQREAVSKHCFSPYCHQCPSASCKQLTLTLSQCFYEDCGYFSVLKDKKVCILPCTLKLFLCVVLIFFISHLVVYICLGCVHIKQTTIIRTLISEKGKSEEHSLSCRNWFLFEQLLLPAVSICFCFTQQHFNKSYSNRPQTSVQYQRILKHKERV